MFLSTQMGIEPVNLFGIENSKVLAHHTVTGCLNYKVVSNIRLLRESGETPCPNDFPLSVEIFVAVASAFLLYNSRSSLE